MKEVNVGSFKEYFLMEAKPFTSKREINWGKVKFTSCLFVSLLIVVLLCSPSGEQEQREFYQKAEKGVINNSHTAESDPTQETIKQLQESQVSMRQVHSSLDHLYRAVAPSGLSNRGSTTDHNSSMILSRGGTDTKTQLSSGTRMTIKLTDQVTVENQSMPLVGIVSKDICNESGIAIPKGAKVLGDVSFDEGSERASIIWRSIILPDGRERPFSALGIGRDGQIGISGRVYSEGMRNAVGQTLTRFVGAYASGSMNTGAFGANQGGHVNGLRNAIAQTATDQANEIGENMQKERKWIELRRGLDTTAVLNQPFAYRDPGVLHGR